MLPLSLHGVLDLFGQFLDGEFGRIANQLGGEDLTQRMDSPVELMDACLHVGNAFLFFGKAVEADYAAVAAARPRTVKAER